MKIKISIAIFLMALIATVAAFQAEAAGDPLYKGKVVDVISVLKGGSGEISSDQAKKLVSEGKPIAFKSEGKLYFIYSEGGSSMVSDLAKYASAPTLGIKGKLKRVHGLNIIIASYMEAM